jgi:hypothetical protein
MRMIFELRPPFLKYLYSSARIINKLQNGRKWIAIERICMNIREKPISRGVHKVVGGCLGLEFWVLKGLTPLYPT